MISNRLRRISSFNLPFIAWGPMVPPEFATTELPNVAEMDDSLEICYDFIGIRSGDLGEEQGGSRSFPTTSRFRSTPPFAPLMVRPSSAEGGMSPEKIAVRPDAQRPINHLEFATTELPNVAETDNSPGICYDKATKRSRKR